MQHIQTLLPWLTALATTYMLWVGLCATLRTDKPIMCVVSESMAPALHRGDIVLLSNRTTHVRVGDIPVVWFEGHPLPMIHRAIRVWNQKTTDESSPEPVFMTKGDNNEDDDLSLYPPGRDYAKRRETVGLAVGYVPFLGWLAILMQETKILRYAAFVLVPLILMISKRRL